MPAGPHQRAARDKAGELRPYLDALVEVLRCRHYGRSTVDRSLFGAVHLGAWMKRSRIRLSGLSESTIRRFNEHLSSCHCPIRSRASVWQRRTDHIAALHVLRLLRSLRVCAPPSAPRLDPLISEYCSWLTEQRGLAQTSVRQRLVIAQRLFEEIRRDLRGLTGAALREFIFREARERAYVPATTQGLVGAVRSFLRFLVARRLIHAELVGALPKIAAWRMSTLPRYVEPPAVERIVRGTSLRSPAGVRDRAVLLLLARLGLRAGEVSKLLLTDVDWAQDRLRVTGSKVHREVWLPLPSDVKAALRRYVDVARPGGRDPHLFLRAQAPHVGFKRASAVNHLFVKAAGRAGVELPIKGPHLLRHSIATRLLRQGWSLDGVGALLRHQRRDTTAIYAKVDLSLLRSVVQPWPT